MAYRQSDTDGIVWDDFTILANTTKLAGANPATDVAYKDGYVLEFITGANKYAYFNIQLPHDYAEGTDVDLHIHWTISDSGSGLGAENVKWVGTYSACSPNLVTPESWPASSNDDATVDVQAISADDHLVTDILTMTGTNFKISECIICSIMRDTGVANNYGHSAYVVSIDVHYQKNTLGSSAEWTK